LTSQKTGVPSCMARKSGVLPLSRGMNRTRCSRYGRGTRRRVLH
jgi:hypothetical protein